jgi:hypothetical protein
MIVLMAMALVANGPSFYAREKLYPGGSGPTQSATTTCTVAGTAQIVDGPAPDFSTTITPNFGQDDPRLAVECGKAGMAVCASERYTNANGNENAYYIKGWKSKVGTRFVYSASTRETVFNCK